MMISEKRRLAAWVRLSRGHVESHEHPGLPGSEAPFSAVPAKLPWQSARISQRLTAPRASSPFAAFSRGRALLEEA
jgi:hypothetical protein